MKAILLALSAGLLSAQGAAFPQGWKPLTFRKIARHTEYSVVREGGEEFIKAVSSAAASGIYREVDAALKDRPILAWRWKIDHALKTADARRKGGDDYAARVYVAFVSPAMALFGSKRPGSALNYIWDNKLPVGTVLPNAYTGKTRMIVLQSGDEKAGRWVSEERDVLEDYRKAFGGEPPALAFIALMTDTDDTGEAVTAYYDGISFKAKRD